MFNGRYCVSYRDADWCQPNADVDLLMKWNDAWLSNVECDDDGLLDRYYGFDSYIGSGAWTTNHQSGSYEDDDGQTCNWNYFVKIVAAPADATLSDGIWYAADGTEIGPVIWGAFAIIQQVENDECAGDHGLLYKNPRSHRIWRLAAKNNRHLIRAPGSISTGGSFLLTETDNYPAYGFNT